MKLLVEIDEETYKDIKKGKVYSSFRDVPQESVLAIANGTPIPDNATNGEIIDLIFPYEKTIDKDWWNAPYQKGGNG